eukprot:4170450-Pyramimonas_sp.AAC.1
MCRRGPPMRIQTQQRLATRASPGPRVAARTPPCAITHKLIAPTRARSRPNASTRMPAHA